MTKEDQGLGEVGNGQTRQETLRIRTGSGGHKEFMVEYHPDQRDIEVLKKNRERLELPSDNKGVLVVYTGGTIGSAPMDDDDPRSPQVVKPWPELASAVPALSLDNLQAINFRIDSVGFKTPLDSSNMGPTEWIAVAKLLERDMANYEGFVIAHGTDTMVYSASALSFMLVGLQKPVILTGAQLSAIGHVRNDALQNLITAILIANPSYSQIPVVPEVCIFFRDKLLRGNRAIKIDADGYVAYDSPNCAELGVAGATIWINKSILRKIDPTQAFSINDRLDEHVIDLSVFPGIQNTNMLGNVLGLDKLRAVVLRTFGAGNTPTEESFLEQLEIAKEKQVIVINVTQCARGSVQMGLYETSAMLMKYGVISGIDITPQAALTKLMVLLGDERKRDDVPRLAQTSLAGEQSESIFVTSMSMKDRAEVTLSKENPSHWFNTELDIRDVAQDVRDTVHAVLMLHSATVIPDDDGRLKVEIYLNAQPDEEFYENHPRYLCAKSPLGMDDTTLVFDVSEAARRLDYGAKNSFTVRLADEGNGKLLWKSAELTLYVSAE